MSALALRPWLASLLSLLTACSAVPAPERFEFALPRSVQAPPVPADNLMSRAKVDLGRRLFWDRRLSADNSFACATCHRPELAFTDGLVVARGLSGEALPRNTPSLANVAYFSAYTWANPRLHTLEGQALVPLLASAPRELGVTKLMPEVCARLAAEPDYVTRFAAAFPDAATPISTATIIAALASFERTLLSLSSPYDRHLAGDRRALSPAALRGKALFESERLGCASCHAGPLLTDAEQTPGQGDPPFHNVGLYDGAGRGLYPRDNPGLYEFTRKPSDMGRFRTPSLRNVTMTPPYMHDGSVATLDEVLDHYAAGGRTLASGPYAGVGAHSRNKDSRIRGFMLSAGERSDLLAFLASLSDASFVGNPAFADPFEPVR